MTINLKEMMFRWWYAYVSKVDKNAEIQFMNYGYHDPDHHVPLPNHHEPNRYSIQLYHQFIKHVPIDQKDIINQIKNNGYAIHATDIVIEYK